MRLTNYFTVNGGVLLVAGLVAQLDAAALAATDSSLLAALASTALLYALVFAACAANLRGRRRMHAKAVAASAPVLLSSIVPHPLGSALERWVHRAALASSAASAAAPPTTALTLVWAGAAWWAWLACRLFAFELAFDALFYVAHRGVHAVPSVYRAVHKLHHSHTHDLRLLSALQMSAADVVLTHTLPVLGALALVPLAPGLELSVAKTYLLFQELYGHAGCEHRGRCFGPAPWLTEALGIELRAADHQRHHVQGSVNFSKRFSLFDRLFGTWAPRDRPRGLKVIDLAEAPAEAYPVVS